MCELESWEACEVCGGILLRAGFSGVARKVCVRCGRCIEAGGPAVLEVDSLACPGCGRRPICESRPTALVDDLTSFHELEDGTRVLVRPLLYSDRFDLAEGYEKLSSESQRLRFFSAPPELSESDLEHLTVLDYRDNFALAAFDLDAAVRPGIAVARYARVSGRPEWAEAAVAVTDACQHRGIGTMLLRLLADRGRENGIEVFVSYVLWENEEVIDGLRAAGARVVPDEPGVARVEIDLPTAIEPARLPDLRALLRHLTRALAPYAPGIWPWTSSGSRTPTPR